MKLQVKDFIFLGIIGALYGVLYFVVSMAFSYLLIFNAFSHVISPAIFGLIGGTIIVFVANKCGKFPAYSLISLIVMFLSLLLGGFYLPWFFTVVVGALLADLISHSLGYQQATAQYVSYVLMLTGQLLGGIVPVWFFVDTYRQEWIERGMTPTAMDDMIGAASGMYGLYAIIICIVCALIGIYIGRKLLNKHFVNAQS